MLVDVETRLNLDHYWRATHTGGSLMHARACRMLGVGVLVTLTIVAADVALALQFVAYGDMPYGAKAADDRTDTAVLTESIAPEIRRRADVPFVVHVGDTGRPSEACSDAWLTRLKQFWETELRKPVLFTPGDNERRGGAGEVRLQPIGLPAKGGVIQGKARHAPAGSPSPRRSLLQGSVRHFFSAQPHIKLVM
jgi:hypothetical protein